MEVDTMKKIFANPEIEVKEFAVENIVTTSVGTEDPTGSVTADTASIVVDAKDLSWVF